MKQKFIVILMSLVLAVSLIACGGGEETTLTGMVVSVDGTVISLVEMDAGNMGGKDFAKGERPELPEGVEGEQGFGEFKPEDFDGTMPEGENFPQRGEKPEMPEKFTMPDDFTMPESGDMPNFGGGKGIENFASDAEIKELDIGNAHISVEIDGGKESGSLNSIKAGSFVTITMDGKGKATYVLVSSRTGFGGGRRPAN